MPVVPRKNMPVKPNAPKGQVKELGSKAGTKGNVYGNPKTAPHGAKGITKALNDRLDAKDKRLKGY